MPNTFNMVLRQKYCSFPWTCMYNTRPIAQRFGTKHPIRIRYINLWLFIVAMLRSGSFCYRSDYLLQRERCTICCNWLLLHQRRWFICWFWRLWEGIFVWCLVSHLYEARNFRLMRSYRLLAMLATCLLCLLSIVAIRRELPGRSPDAATKGWKYVVKHKNIFGSCRNRS